VYDWGGGSLLITKPLFIESILGSGNTNRSLVVLYGTDRTAAKLLATPIRYVGIASPELTDAYRRIGLLISGRGSCQYHKS